MDVQAKNDEHHQHTSSRQSSHIAEEEYDGPSMVVIEHHCDWRLLSKAMFSCRFNRDCDEIEKLETSLEYKDEFIDPSNGKIKC